MANALRRFRSAATVWLILLLGAACAQPKPPGEAPTAANPPPPTFTKDVAPILFAHCTPCHRPGQATPFALVSYPDASAQAQKMADATSKHRMPPWLPDLADAPTFVGERRLRVDEIATIEVWAKSDAAEGVAKNLSRVPVWSDGWELGKPDLVVTLPKPYMLMPAKAGAHDRFRTAVLPVALLVGRYLRALAFRPGAARVVQSRRHQHRPYVEPPVFRPAVAGRPDLRLAQVTPSNVEG